MDFRDRHVVVTGGTGALGRAVVDALLAAGAHCHVPYRQEKVVTIARFAADSPLEGNGFEPSVSH
jgi:NAD(P)-dependent dehydrogenase (short-subunit alcohol dehydrogenase family)